MKSKMLLATFAVALTLFASAAVAPAEEIKALPESRPSTNIIAQAANGSITLLAKDAATHGTTVRYEPQPHKDTIGYWTRAEDWVSWNFKLRTPGSFTVELTQACGKGSGGSEYAVTIGNHTLTDKVPDTGAFTNFIHRRIGSVKLNQPGDYTVSVKPISKPGLAVMDLRAITLIPRTKE